MNGGEGGDESGWEGGLRGCVMVVDCMISLRGTSRTLQISRSSYSKHGSIDSAPISRGERRRVGSKIEFYAVVGLYESTTRWLGWL